MNAQILLLVAAIGGVPTASGQTAGVFSVNEPAFAVPLPGFLEQVNRPHLLWSDDGQSRPGSFCVVRGQNAPYDEDPSGKSAGGAVPPTPFAMPYAWFPGGNWVSPFSQPVPQDPFLGQPGAGAGGADPWGGTFFGAHGMQPFRFGWTSRLDVGYIPDESSKGATGDFKVFETDVELKYTSPFLPGIIASVAPQFNYRAWDGPDTTTPIPSSLPGSVYRFGVDLILQTPGNALWSAMVAFNPSLNTDFDDSISDDALNWDGRGMVFFRASPQWLLAGGAGYLDRVHDRIIPYAGVVVTPDDRWEFRIMFPESRISFFLGNCWGYSQWIYARGEYHIEAYQIHNDFAGVRDQVELEDYRLLIGLRTEVAGLSGYAEFGWVFSRDIDFKVSSTSFDPSDGLIVRAGLRY